MRADLVRESWASGVAAVLALVRLATAAAEATNADAQLDAVASYGAVRVRNRAGFRLPKAMGCPSAVAERMGGAAAFAGAAVDAGGQAVAPVELHHAQHLRRTSYLR